MKPILIRFALMTCTTLLIGAAGDRKPEIYLLMGQSNMSGRGSMDDLTAAERIPDQNILLYGNDGRLTPAVEPVDSAARQLDRVSADPDAAVGPALPFARMLRTLRSARVVLVPCAKGGSAIREWKPGGGRDTLYGSCLARAREAGHQVAGVLWYQGETDGNKAAAASAWAESFSAMVDQLRGDLGQPTLPLVLVELADRPGGIADPRYPAWETVRAAQRSVVGSCTAIVPARDLPLAPDQLHLTTDGERTLGGRLALTMRRVQRRCSGGR